MARSRTAHQHFFLRHRTLTGQRHFGAIRASDDGKRLVIVQAPELVDVDLLDVTLRRELIEDFFVDLSVYYDYDGQPPGDDPVKDDYGVVTSVGYSF